MLEIAELAKWIIKALSQDENNTTLIFKALPVINKMISYTEKF